ncbi:MAG TPA: alkaline phosphatase PhoX [Solirubrobacter sp.]
MAQIRLPAQEPHVTRREALRRGAAFVAGASVGAQVLAATGAPGALAETTRAVARRATDKPGYGPLTQHTGEFSLPAGFTVFSFGAAGTPMSDGLATPRFHDGTAAVDGGSGRVTLIRNHEGSDPGKAIGPANAYDRVAQGGVTTSLWDPATGQLLGSSLILNGTDNNCNGGTTPWGSWLSCEESTVGKADGFEKPHGYVFEVPLTATTPIEPKPIKAMGRFEHEACAIDPKTGVVYMTEDNGDPGDGFYRYIPHVSGKLAQGGRLEMLAVHGRSKYDTATGQKVGRTLQCEWVPVKDPDPTDAEKHPDAVYQQGRALGAARFLGLEGALWSGDSVYFVASEAGDKEKGQIWRYTPSGTKKGRLTLLYESRSGTVLDQPDGLTVSPRGGVVVCEDGDGEDVNGGTNFLRVLTPKGTLETFARNDTALDLHEWDDEAKKGSIGRSEWSGACYSPDGKWLFVHIQIPGKTFAITGPWDNGWL